MRLTLEHVVHSQSIVHSVHALGRRLGSGGGGEGSQEERGEEDEEHSELIY